ncbi:hypothetical protein D3C73_905110 [compost metagenome]
MGDLDGPHGAVVNPPETDGYDQILCTEPCNGIGEGCDIGIKEPDVVPGDDRVVLQGLARDGVASCCHYEGLPRTGDRLRNIVQGFGVQRALKMGQISPVSGHRSLRRTTHVAVVFGRNFHCAERCQEPRPELKLEVRPALESQCLRGSGHGGSVRCGHGGDVTDRAVGRKPGL